MTTTFGTAKRGIHIVESHCGRTAEGFAFLTLVGPRLTLTDAYDTAAIARGGGKQSWLKSLDGYEALVVLFDGQEWRTPGFSSYGSRDATQSHSREQETGASLSGARLCR